MKVPPKAAIACLMSGIVIAACREDRLPTGIDQQAAAVTAPPQGTPVFGPKTYTRTTGKPRKVIDQFPVADPTKRFTLFIQNGQGNERADRVTSAVIEINEVRVIGPEDFGKQVDEITRPVSLLAENRIAVELRGKPTTSLVLTVLGEEPLRMTTAVIPTSGGTVELTGIATVVFPAGAFSSPQQVSVAATSTSAARALFAFTSDTTPPPLANEIRINSSTVAPALAVEVRVALADAFIASIPVDLVPRVFAQLVTGGPMEHLDHFEPFPSNYDPLGKLVRAQLPPDVFDDERRSDLTFEAVLMVGFQEISESSPSRELGRVAAQAATCVLAPIAPPLQRASVVVSSFAPGIHRGTDYRAKDDNVVATANGVIEAIDFESYPLPKPSKRTGLTTGGGGQYIRVRHDDRSRSVTVYMHLVSGSPQALGWRNGMRVRLGDVIGKADSTPPEGVTGPHLHLDYRTSRGTRIDPDPCIPATAWGDLSAGGLAGLGSFTLGTTFKSLPFSWGAADLSRLGDGSTASRNSPAAVGGMHTFLLMSAGADHGCGIDQQASLTASGRAWCWGSGEWGQLGNGASGTGAIATTPVLVSSTRKFSLVTAGTRHTCGIETTDARTAISAGPAYCWGEASLGELGNGEVTEPPDFPDLIRPTPVAVLGGLQFKWLSAGDFYTCGVATSGAGYCWGSEARGEFGDGGSARDLFTEPTAVTGGLSFVMVDVSSTLTCGVTADTLAYCWGENRDGQTGKGTISTEEPSPVPVAGGHKFVVVSTGFDHSCGVTPEGDAYCWGDNRLGALGDGTANSSATPVGVAVIDGLKFRSITADFQYTCGIATTGEAYCWGLNDVGQLGIGTTEPFPQFRPTPQRVQNPPAPLATAIADALARAGRLGNGVVKQPPHRPALAKHR